MILTGGTEFDVIVVGGGGGGLAAALSAAEAGARVLLLEKTPALGGTTGRAVGSVTAAATPFQRRAGIEDSTERYFADLDLYTHPEGAADDLALRRVLTENAGPTLDWLVSLGLIFTGPNPEPPHTRPRMHNVLPGAKAFIHCLAGHCRKRGVEIRCAHAVEALSTAGPRVIGVRARAQGGEVHLRAGHAVILASGDYSADGALRRRHLPAEAQTFAAISPANTGDGHLMAEALGAKTLNGHIFSGPEIRFPPPERPGLVDRLPQGRLMGLAARMALHTLPRWMMRPLVVSYMTAAMAPSPGLFAEGAILINAEGRRFAEETADPAPAIAGQTDAMAFIVLDGRIAALFSAWPHFISTAPGIAYAYLADYGRYRRDIFHAAPDLGRLAGALAMPAQALADTVAAHNDAVGSARALTRPPFTALGPAKSWIMTTDGGLDVTPDLQVKGADGAPIPGLYAAGAVGSGALMIPGHGQHLGWAFTSGRLAGKAAAGGTPAAPQGT